MREQRSLTAGTTLGDVKGGGVGGRSLWAGTTLGGVTWRRRWGQVARAAGDFAAKNSWSGWASVWGQDVSCRASLCWVALLLEHVGLAQRG